MDDDRDDGAIDDLLERWESLRAECRAPDVEEMCRDRPDLAAEVRRRVDLLVAFERAEESAGSSTGIVVSGPGPAGWGVPPRSLGPYEILETLGAGGMGIVYRARQAQPRRVVALKVIRPERSSDITLRRFEHESQVLGRLRHPGIAQIYEARDDPTPAGPRPYFVMEFVEGRGLARYADEEGLDVRGRVGLMIRVCDAVQYAHQQGIIHRDLKPGNILVDAAGQTKVLDFGLARALAPDDELAVTFTADDVVLGTIPYMSPEQAAGHRDAVDTRTDIYSLGLVAYELLAGRRAFDLKGLSRLDALRVVERGEIMPLHRARPDLKGDLDTIVGKALRLDKDRRYPSCAEFAADLHRFLDERPIEARSASGLYQARKFIRRNKALSSALAGMVLAVVVGLALVTWQWLEARRNLALADSNRERALDVIRQFFATVEKEPRLQAPELREFRRKYQEQAADLLGAFAAEHSEDPRARRLSILSLTRLGQVEVELGRPEAAREAGSKALEQAEDWLRDAPADPARLDALGQVLHANLQWEEDATRCLALFRRSEHIAAALPPVAGEKRRTATIVRAINARNTSGRLLKAGDRDRGLTLLRLSCDLGEKALAGGGADDLILDALGRSYSDLAEVEENDRQIPAAEAAFRRSNALFARRFADQPHVLQVLLDYCQSSEELGAFLLRRGTLAGLDASGLVGEQIRGLLETAIQGPGWRPDERLTLRLRFLRAYHNAEVGLSELQKIVASSGDEGRYEKTLEQWERLCRKTHDLADQLRPLVLDNEDLARFDLASCANLYFLLDRDPNRQDEARAWLARVCPLLPADLGRINDPEERANYQFLRKLCDQMPRPPGPSK